MTKIETSEESPNPPQGEGDKEAGNGLLYTTFASSVNFLRPFAPQLVPVVVCVFFIPLVLVASGFSGYVVWSGLSTSWESPLYLQYGDGVAPYAHSAIPPIHSNQRYDISLRLALPASESNLALGNFMATLTLSNASNKTLATVRRPAIAVVSRSWRFFGEENVLNLDIPMMTSFLVGTSHLLADISLGRQDDWRTFGNGEGRELSVISAYLHGKAVPHGIRGLAIRFPILSSLFAALIFLCLSVLIMGVCVLPIMLPNGLEDAVKSGQTSFVPFPASDRPRRKKRSHFKRSSDLTSPSLSVKEEEESFANMPPGEDPVPERLRQRKTSMKREMEVET